MASSSDPVEIPFLTLDTINIDITKEFRADGSIIIYSQIPLDLHPYRLTDRLIYWAKYRPDQVFLARNNSFGQWNTLTYAQTLFRVRNIAQALLRKNISPEKPLAIISENCLEHALMALAALHIGIPYAPISPAYALKSTDYGKLKHVIHLLDPGLIYVSNVLIYESALKSISEEIEIISPVKSINSNIITPFDELLNTIATDAVDLAYQAIRPDTIAKILFTSGSTGLPKGVINTHENISTNWQQITQTFPFIKEENLEFIDWLPWNHTFGGNHNFGLTLFNGGSLYIDEGNPSPSGIKITLENLKQRSPTIYFNVPKGFEELIPFLRNDPALCQQLFSKLKMFFYAGAGLSQYTWDALQEISINTIGKKIMIGTGLGCTEASPSALFSSRQGGYAGLLGVPVPGLILKLVPIGDKWEARYKGKNITPGYWRQNEITLKSFDEEGFYCTGDALKFADDNDINKGLLFDGRIAEDFKLNTGTWVSVGPLRSQIIIACGGLIQDAVITGHDRAFVGAILFLDLNYCNMNLKLKYPLTIQELAANKIIKNKINECLITLSSYSQGSSNFIHKALLADFILTLDKNEITDKGSINQRMVIQNHPESIDLLYSELNTEKIISITNFNNK